MTDSKRIAIMQPYFFPYAGYFRLFSMVDEFVIFDCVQFPRRGRVHRTEIPGPKGKNEWLTLPLVKHPRDTRIKDIRFAENARASFDNRLARFTWLDDAQGASAQRIRNMLYAPLEGALLDYLEDCIRTLLDELDIKTTISRSSKLEINPLLRGQERIISIAQEVGATVYLNPPGGKSLYSEKEFQAAGLTLSFLPPYKGRFRYLLPALMTHAPAEIRADIYS